MATHDYVIDNGTGSAVRTDLNNALAAIVSNNSSSTEPSTKYAYQWWADTNTGILKIRNSSNNGWVELLQLDGTLTLEDGTASSPALAFRDDLDTGVFSSAANAFNIATAGVERIEFGTTECVVNDTGLDVDFRVEGNSITSLLHVDAGNNRVGIGILTPDVIFHVHASSAGSVTAPSDSVFVVENGATARVAILTPNNVAGHINFGDPDDNDAGEIKYDHSSNFMSFTTGGHERLRIDSSGSMGLGATNLLAHLHVEASGSQAFFSKGVNTTACSTTFGASTAHILRSENAELAFGLHNASPFHLYIQGRNNSNNNYPIMLNPLGGAVTVNSGVTQSAIGIFDVKAMTDGILSIRPITSIHSGTGVGLDVLNDSNSAIKDLCIRANTHVFKDGSAEFMRFDGQRLFIRNTSNPLPSTGTGVISITVPSGNDGISIKHEHTGNCINIWRTAADGSVLNFFRGNVSQNSVGSISVTGSATAYNTGSDYRLKENATLISDAITRLKTLKPYRFNFKNDPKTIVDGFFAHEVTTVPNAISGTKDEVDDEGKPVFQSLDYSKIVPLLTAALQESISKIEVLETKVASLEAA